MVAKIKISPDWREKDNQTVAIVEVSKIFKKIIEDEDKSIVYLVLDTDTSERTIGYKMSSMNAGVYIGLMYDEGKIDLSHLEQEKDSSVFKDSI